MGFRQFPARLSRAWLPWSGGYMYLIVDVALGAKMTAHACLGRPVHRRKHLVEETKEWILMAEADSIAESP